MTSYDCNELRPRPRSLGMGFKWHHPACSSRFRRSAEQGGWTALFDHFFLYFLSFFWAFRPGCWGLRRVPASDGWDGMGWKWAFKFPVRNVPCRIFSCNKQGGIA